MEQEKPKMGNYLSYGGGVNSTALYLHLLDQGWIPGDPDKGFEAVYVDHKTDWPETREYVKDFATKYPVTIIDPAVRIEKDIHKDFDDLYEYAHAAKMFPSRVARWCTERFKSRILNKYHKTPCFVFIGYHAGEAHRAKISSSGGQEFRWPLIEDGIDQQGCIDIIKAHGLEVPMKSGCYICPYQRVGELRKLRRVHPDLFCKLERLENYTNDLRAKKGLEPYYCFKKPVRKVAEKGIEQGMLWAEDEYPPCECGL